MKLKLFEEYSESYYQTIDFDDYDKSYHNRLEMSDKSINKIKNAISSRTTNPLALSVPSYSVMFIWDNNPSQYQIKIFEADDEWFYCAIKQLMTVRDPGQRRLMFWRRSIIRSIDCYKCDQLEGLIQLLKNKKII